MTFSGFYTQEQKNLIRFVKTLVGASPTYVQLYYNGVSAGSEFLTYNAKKLYICFTLNVSTSNNPILISALSGLAPYDEANNVVTFHGTWSPYWDTTGATGKVVVNDYFIENLYFSRIVGNNYNALKFNGIKVTWP